MALLDRAENFQYIVYCVCRTAGKKVKEKRQRYSTKINIFLLKILKKKISAQDQLPKTEKNYTIKLLSVLRTTVIGSPM